MAKNAELARELLPEPKQGKTPEILFRKLDLIDDDLLPEPDFQDPRIEQQRTEKAASLYQKAISGLSEFLTEVARFETSAKITNLEEIIEQLVGSIREGDELLLKSLYTKEEKYNLLTHMLNVSILALKLGIGLKLPEEELQQLGFAAILEDIGMQKVPHDLLFAPRKLSPAEYEKIKEHSHCGYEIIKKWGVNFIWLAETVLNIHEREDGSGYPNGRTGNEINQLAKIIGLADTYEALTHDRPHRKRMLHFDAIKYIINSAKATFSKPILKVLLQQLSTYPLHSFVKLNSGEIAQVTKINPLSPLCPVVRIMYNSCRGKIRTAKSINLAKTSLLYIVGSVFEEDLSH
jgi:HD-GYP domain-containing protein (c-di-GMP phosphodiesterase class II)